MTIEDIYNRTRVSFIIPTCLAVAPPGNVETFEERFCPYDQQGAILGFLTQFKLGNGTNLPSTFLVALSRFIFSKHFYRPHVLCEQ